uniref:Uncharacterized protein n=1 Tax=Magallana gigas TaxID=29159 RepID=K1RN86_MAGGI
MVRNSPRDVCTGPSSPPGPPANFDNPKRSDSPTSSERIPTTSRLGCFRNNLKSYSLSEDTEKLLFSSWSKGTNSSYDSAWNKWTRWCLERQTDPFSVSISSVLEFLSWLHHSGYQYRTINVHRSGISSVLPFVDNLPVGQHYLLKHLMKGILKENPPLPKYTVLWDVDLVLSYLKDLPDNKDLSLKVLSKKLAILLAIAAPKRVSELARLDIRFMKLTPEYVVFRLPGISKTQRDCNAKEVTYHRFSDERICVLECLCVYLEATKGFRNGDIAEVSDPLLRAVVKPHKGLTPNTISNWTAL